MSTKNTRKAAPAKPAPAKAKKTKPVQSAAEAAAEKLPLEQAAADAADAEHVQPAAPEQDEEPAQKQERPPEGRFANLVNAQGDRDCFVIFGTPAPRESAKAWAAWHAKNLRTHILVASCTTGEVLDEFDGRGAAPVTVAEKTPKPPLNGVASSRAPGAGDNAAVKVGFKAEAFDLACQPEGVSRRRLTELAEGRQISWTYVLAALAKKEGKAFRVDKSGKSPVYYVE